MSQDDDIARVAAALRAPGLKYRNFGNEPVRPEIPLAAKGTERNHALNAVLGHDLVAPMPAEEPRPTMKLIAEALSPSTVPLAGPFPTAAVPAWPLLDALAAPTPPAEPRESARGTLVQLFGGLAAPPAAAAAPMPLSPAAFAAPASVPAAPVSAAIPAAGIFPSTWAPQPPAAEPAGASGLVPADRVTTPLADVLQNLGRGGAAANPAFAGLRLPGSGPR